MTKITLRVKILKDLLEFFLRERWRETRGRKAAVLYPPAFAGRGGLPGSQMVQSRIKEH